MTRIVQRMAVAELVTLTHSAEDARVTMVALTATGESKLVEARQATSPVYQQVITGLSARDFDRLLVLLDRVYHNLEA
jgi:DNA-binding MarR family transcriptional regulator